MNQEIQTINQEMEALKIKYDGLSSIDANTYINSLLHFTNLVQEVNKNIPDSKEVEVRIKANEPGSFIVDLIFGVSAVPLVSTLFSSETLSYLSNFITVFKETFNVAKHLKGKELKSIVTQSDAVRIENNYGEVAYFDLKGANIYLNDSTVRDVIQKNFDTLNNDESVSGFEILDKDNKKLLDVPRSEFYQLSSEGAELPPQEGERIEVDQKANLNISSLDYELKKKWDFYYLGNKISAKMTDVEFALKINAGEKFAKGDTLVAELEIKQRFNRAVNAYVNIGYRIIRIIDHIERPEQGKLGF